MKMRLVIYLEKRFVNINLSPNLCEYVVVKEKRNLASFSQQLKKIFLSELSNILPETQYPKKVCTQFTYCHQSNLENGGWMATPIKPYAITTTII